MSPVVLALAAHPDDIEFVMAGTLLLLGERGCRLHYMNLSSGNCGSVEEGSQAVRERRAKEAQTAAQLLGATWHPPLADDLEIFYDDKTLRRLAAVIREVHPDILLIPSPEDYMEDHMNTCRLGVAAAFSRGMPNYQTQPMRPALTGSVTLYHAMPHGLRDGLGRRIRPSHFVNTWSVQARKQEALAAHASQRTWLDLSQGEDAYLGALDLMSREVGTLSGCFEHAEGWRKHSHLGFCEPKADPLARLLDDQLWIDPAYEASLEGR